MPFTGSKATKLLSISANTTRPKIRESKHTHVYGPCTCTLPWKMHYYVTDTTENVGIPEDERAINVACINK